MLKKFLIWLIKNIIILLLITLIFSTVALDVPSLVKEMFKDIFSYASPETQKEVIGKLTGVCSGLDKNNSTEESSLPVNLSRIGSLCKDYNSNKTNDREFFFNVIGSAVPDNFGLPNSNAMEKYYAAMNFLNSSKIIYFTIIAVLLLALYLLAGTLNAFLVILSSICFSMGMLILIPYIAVIAYDKLVGIDTTPLLETVLGSNLSLDIKAIISLVLLLLLRTYTHLVITLGIIFTAIGIGGKVYSWKLKKQSSKPKSKEGKKIKEEKAKKEKPTKEEEDEAHRHRDRSTKEILDELDEMHKKKLKEKENN
ncbi:hypothetical protein HYX05_03830 [Candidatus Woesearchaeota archaeon]|nr:hypothetical protein [Candidatus Woesearchaeota archaeon]